MNLMDVLAKPVAHRGLHDATKGIPENSPSAFERACEHGLAIECDIQLSGDDVPMIIHDTTIDRVSEQSGKVSAISADQLGRIPLIGSKNNDKTLRFDELLQLVNSRVPIAVEMKPQGSPQRDTLMAQKAAEITKSYKGPLAYISFSPSLLQQVRKAGFGGPLGIVVARFDSEDAKKHLSPWQRFSMRHMLHYPMTRFHFVDCDHKALKMTMVRLFRAFGMPVAAWTITSPEEEKKAAEHCDQIAFEGYMPKALSSGNKTPTRD